MRSVKFLTLAAILTAVVEVTAAAQTKPSPALPAIVASIALTGQTSAIPATPLMKFIGTLYRVSVYYEMTSTTANCASSVSPQIQWTDDTGELRTRSMGPYECFDLDYGEASYVVHGTIGSELLYSVAANSNLNGLVSYNLYMTAERLQ